MRVAWLSLDEAESDPIRFLAYLVASLQSLALSEDEGIAANIGAGVLGALQAPQLPPIESILTGLLNEIAAFPYPFTLVLDDYVVIDSKSIDQALTFLLEHLPRQMHLVIATREDPNLPLARLRAGGQLTELRAADLQFAPVEAADFLNQVMGLNLSAEDIAILETRTEGWIAGLQLAAISTRGREDVHGFIKAFAGDNRHIVDYLVEEVLQHQPEHVRSFLLQSSILDWLSGPLCDAVCDREESHILLEALERGNCLSPRWMISAAGKSLPRLDRTRANQTVVRSPAMDHIPSGNRPSPRWRQPDCHAQPGGRRVPQPGCLPRSRQERTSGFH